MAETPRFNSEIAQNLLFWYNKNKRNLPWRGTKSPYKIWLSEILLQQTKISQGLPYYISFIENFPKLEDLATSSEEEVLKLWQGLGYYSRARNLHFTAKYIFDELDNNFPDNYKDLLKLKGVGDYTASAIASFSFGECTPVLDGNVYRFVSRYFGVSTPINSGKANKEFKEILFKIIDKNNPAEFNQAIMEFGSLQCVPKNPNCEICPFFKTCFAYNNKLISDLPIKLKSKKSINRYFTYYYVTNFSHLFLKKRIGKGIWENLYEFPLSENMDVFESEIIDKNVFEINKKKFLIKKVHQPIKHILSHQNIYAKLIEIGISDTITLENFIKIKKEDFETYPIHRLMEKMILLVENKN